MNQMIEAVYEDNVFKPLSPVKGLNTNDKVLIMLCRYGENTGLNELIGTLTLEEAEEMMAATDTEFSTIEGEW